MIKLMKTARTSVLTRNPNILRIVLVTALILMVPLVAMRFTDEVDWSLADFVIIGILLIGTGLVYELIRTKVNAKYRAVIAVLLVAAILLIWAELAVGVFGTPFAGS
jgi:hypothetical protein